MIGRAFIGPVEAGEMISTEEPKLIPIGYNIGKIKVAIYNVSEQLVLNFTKNCTGRHSQLIFSRPPDSQIFKISGEDHQAS